MAKSQLEIVLVDEGDAAPQQPAPTPASAAASATGVPAREREASATAAAVSEKPDQPSRGDPDERRDPAPGTRERRDTTSAVDVAARVAEATARAFGLGQLVSEIQRWQQILHQVGGMFKTAAVREDKATATGGTTTREADRAPSPKAPSADKQQPQATRQAREETSDSSEGQLIASVKNFMRVTAPKAFNEFTSGAVDALRAFMGGPDSDDSAPTVAPSRPSSTAARDDRQQTVRVDVKHPPAERNQLAAPPRPPPPPASWAPTPRPSAPSGIPLPAPRVAGAPVAATMPPPVMPSAYVAPPPVTAVPATAAASTAAPMSGVAAWTSAAVPAARAASATSAVPTAASAAGSAAATTAAPAAGGVAGAAAALGPVAIAAVAVVAGFTALVVGTKKLTNYLAGEAEKIAGYSSQTAAATAESEIRRERAMISRGSRVGPQMAQFERSRGQNEERLMQMATSIQGLMLQLMSALQPFIEKSLSVGEAGVAGLEVISKVAELLYDQVTGDLPELARDLKDLNKLTSKLGKEALEVFKGDGEKDPLDADFLEQFESIGGDMAARLYGDRAAMRGRARRPTI